MNGGGGRLSKVGTLLIIIFAITLALLLAQLLYVLWRRRLFRRRSGGGDDHLSQHSSSQSSFSSKELLYFFCVGSHPNAVTAPDTIGDLDSSGRPEMEVIDVDLLKIHGVFGPPRFLFTIKEEEGEHAELPAEICVRSSVEKEGKRMDDGGSRVTLQECFKAAGESPPPETTVAVAVEIDCHDWNDTTPFSTPCASPMYFTPLASPVREIVNGSSMEAGGVCGSATTSFSAP